MLMWKTSVSMKSASVGYLLEKEKEAAKALKLAQSYPAVSTDELNRPSYGILPFSAFTTSDPFPRNPLLTPDTLVKTR